MKTILNHEEKTKLAKDIKLLNIDVKKWLNQYIERFDSIHEGREKPTAALKLSKGEEDDSVSMISMMISCSYD